MALIDGVMLVMLVALVRRWRGAVAVAAAVATAVCVAGEHANLLGNTDGAVGAG